MKNSGLKIAALSLTIFTMSACTASAEKQCVTGGCSGELCVEAGGAPAASPCTWTERYRCYETVGTCERQVDGTCGWTPTDALSQCLSKANSRPPFLPHSAPQ